MTLGDGNHVTLTGTPGTNGQIVANGGGFDVQLSYTYADELSGQTFGVQVSDIGGATTGASINTFSVADAIVTGSKAATTTGGVEGVTAAVLSGATFTDANPGNHTSDFTATIAWGDSTPTTAGTVSYQSQGSTPYPDRISTPTTARTRSRSP